MGSCSTVKNFILSFSFPADLFELPLETWSESLPFFDHWVVFYRLVDLFLLKGGIRLDRSTGWRGDSFLGCVRRYWARNRTNLRVDCVPLVRDILLAILFPVKFDELFEPQGVFWPDLLTRFMFLFSFAALSSAKLLDKLGFEVGLTHKLVWNVKGFDLFVGIFVDFMGESFISFLKF